MERRTRKAQRFRVSVYKRIAALLDLMTTASDLNTGNDFRRVLKKYTYNSFRCGGDGTRIKIIFLKPLVTPLCVQTICYRKLVETVLVS